MEKQKISNGNASFSKIIIMRKCNIHAAFYSTNNNTFYKEIQLTTAAVHCNETKQRNMKM